MIRQTCATLLGVMVLVGTSAAAAEERQIGARVGPSFAIVVFAPEGSEAHDHRVAVGGGGFAVLPVAPRLAVQIEGLVSPRGAKLYDPDEELTGTVLLHYLDIPVLLRIKGPTYGPRSLHLFAGPYVGIRVGATRQISSAGRGFTSGVRLDMRHEVERFELGITGGAGADIGRRVVIDGRYSWGLTSLNRNTSDAFRIRNRALTITAGARF